MDRYLYAILLRGLIFSGMVKAIDPMGTAFKMKEYFGEFRRHIEGSFLSFLSPLWPFFERTCDLGFDICHSS